MYLQFLDIGLSASITLCERILHRKDAGMELNFELGKQKQRVEQFLQLGQAHILVQLYLSQQSKMPIHYAVVCNKLTFVVTL